MERHRAASREGLLGVHRTGACAGAHGDQPARAPRTHAPLAAVTRRTAARGAPGPAAYAARLAALGRRAAGASLAHAIDQAAQARARLRRVGVDGPLRE